MEKNRLLRTAWVLLLLVLISTQWVCGLYARYTVEASGGDSARAAAFVFATQGQENSRYLNLTGIQKPGDSVTYTFTVTNQKGSTVSEVAEKYRFAVQLNGSMPLKCTVSNFKDNAVVLTANISESTTKLPVTSQSPESAERQFAASKGEAHTYTMTVVWPETENDIKYASRSAVAEVLLTVTAEQLD